MTPARWKLLVLMGRLESRTTILPGFKHQQHFHFAIFQRSKRQDGSFLLHDGSPAQPSDVHGTSLIIARDGGDALITTRGTRNEFELHFK